MHPIPAAILTAMISIALPAAETATTGFAGFDQRARAGERLNVVFFGASLTWGANASDQENTSYRAVVRDRLEEHYPAAHFRCWDGAIGGTGSQLGAFRVDRDVFAHHPDLVFVDFTANDDIYSADPETLASYESIIRRIATAGIPVVQVAFPFKWNIDAKKLSTMKRLAAHQAIAEAYGSGWGDAVTLITQRIDAGQYSLADIWVTDGVHPHDRGYREFADAAWSAYLAAIEAKQVPHVPAAMLNPDTYMSLRRARLATLGTLPAGWSSGETYLTAINHDWLMSRWLDGLAIARNRALGANGKPEAEAVAVAPLRLSVQAASIVVFGEASADSGTFRVRIDGAPVVVKHGQIKDTDLFDANRWKTGNGHLVFELARGLDATRPHLVEIEPVLAADRFQELRLESLCVAGGPATVALAP